MSDYREELDRSMQYLASKQDTIFLGQSMIYGGIAIAKSFKNIPQDRKIEMPVAENLQLGMSTGLALKGFVPVTVYPRWNFLLLAADQLVNHLDKLVEMTEGQFNPKVIIRVAVGVKRPVDPQEQHVGDFSKAFSEMLRNVNVIKLEEAKDIFPAYEKAYTTSSSTILVEEHQF
jgi:pyruvate/2-oxoglutarate/acetoin dehydrogenase E1 component